MMMERPFGWKAEYFSGKGHLTPREHHVRTQLTLTPQAVIESAQSTLEQFQSALVNE
jgi:hypothetical protein